MKTTSLIILALCVLCASADFKFRLQKQIDADLSTRIVGGKEASEGQFPYQVALRKTDSHSTFCGGSILSSRFLLTAVHCTRDYVEAEIYAAAGALYEKDGVSIGIEKIIQHEEYNREKKLNDIGLLRTVEEIVFTEFIQPIALPTHGTGITNVVIAGFGLTKSPYYWSNSKKLKYIESKTIDNEVCKKSHPDFLWNVGENHICTFIAKGIGNCFGDSGKSQYVWDW